METKRLISVNVKAQVVKAILKLVENHQLTILNLEEINESVQEHMWGNATLKRESGTQTQHCGVTVLRPGTVIAIAGEAVDTNISVEGLCTVDPEEFAELLRNAEKVDLRVQKPEPQQIKPCTLSKESVENGYQ